MNSFDPMAIAVDWLDAYRASDPDIDNLYADDAAILCGCDDETAISNSAARKAYWASRYTEKPAGDLIDIEDRGGNVVALTYRAAGNAVLAVLSLDESSGLITLQRCGPL